MNLVSPIYKIAERLVFTAVMCTGIGSSTNKTASDQNSKEVTNLRGSALKCAFFLCSFESMSEMTSKLCYYLLSETQLRDTI